MSRIGETTLGEGGVGRHGATGRRRTSAKPSRSGGGERRPSSRLAWKYMMAGVTSQVRVRVGMGVCDDGATEGNEDAAETRLKRGCLPKKKLQCPQTQCEIAKG